MEWIEVSIETVHEGIDIMAQIFYELGVQVLLSRIQQIFPALKIAG